MTTTKRTKLIRLADEYREARRRRKRIKAGAPPMSQDPEGGQKDCGLCIAGIPRRRDGLWHWERDFEGELIYRKCAAPRPIRWCRCPAGPGFGIRTHPHICEKCGGTIQKPLRALRNRGVPE